MKLHLKTPAKINLGLWILGKRKDGFHELETLFQMVSLYDEMGFETGGEGINLTCNRDDIPTGGRNLVVRAAEALRQHVPGGEKFGCRIHLEKRIPHGAGLGGGSGNAAGTLLALNRLWDLRLSTQELMQIGAGLGSDVPFFLGSPAAIGKGRGEQLTPVKAACRFHVLLLYPRLSVSTAEVYNHLNLKLTSPENNISILTEFFSQSDITRLGACLHNDLEPVVLQRFTKVRETWEFLRAQNAQGVLVSGSGSTVFAIFSDARQANQAQARCNAGDWDTFLTETVSSLSEFLPETVLNYPGG